VTAKRTQAQQAYDTIRTKIITVELRPGEMLNEQALTEMTGFGRSPVRDAMQWLLQEGLVDVSPRRGTFVSQVNFDDVQQIFDLRVAMEKIVADVATTRVQPEHIAALDALIARVDASESETSDSAIDREFHTTMLAITGNRYLARYYSDLHDASLRLFHLTRCETDTRADQHATLVATRDALRDRDSDALERILMDHIRDFRRRVGGAISL
jgi:DNA-binding GntR family transcriptional regulator